MKCFYHSADLDGKCSAAIVRRKYPDIELIGIDYGQPFPWDDITPDEAVIMVDFSLQPFGDMVRLSRVARLCWIDHHKSALDEAKVAGWLSDRTLHEAATGKEAADLFVPGIRRDGIGACAQTWEYLYPGEEMPRAVHLLAEYDVWNHSDPDCLPFQYGSRLYDLKPENGMWEVLLMEPSQTQEGLVDDGKIILEYQSQQNKGHARTLCFDAELGDLKVLAANAGPTNSQFFDSLWDREKYHAMCLFQWRPKGGKWTVSLYSDRDDVDVSEACKVRGGGGHKGAAGFQCAEVPFPLRTEKEQG